MSDVLKRRLIQVRLRCMVNLLLEQIALVALAGAGIGVIILLLHRLFALGLWQTRIGYIFAGLCGTAVLVLWLIKMPGKMQLSLTIDQRLHIHDRFSTSLALAGSDDPFAKAACSEARGIIDKCDMRKHFPVRPTRTWGFAVSSWLIVLLMVLFLPQKDLLGLLKKQQQKAGQQKQVDLAKQKIKESTARVKRVLAQLDDPNLSKEAGALAEFPDSMKPQLARRQAMRKLSDLADRLRKQKTSQLSDSLDMLRQMLKQLRSSPKTLSSDLYKALARGQFDKASQLLRDLQDKLNNKALSREQKELLKQQLKDLARQLSQLADSKKQLQKELQKMGLPGKMAQLNKNQLKKELAKRGISKEKIDQIMKKLEASRMAANRCSALSKALGCCGAGGEMSADELASAMQQFDDLDSEAKQCKLSEDALAEMDRAIACMGEGMCEGLGAKGPFRSGQSNRYGAGSGGPGHGYGAVDSDTEGQTVTAKTRVKNKTQDGPVIASWYFKGDQLKGQARQKFKNVVMAGRDSAAEAIDEHQIPKKYEKSVKSYFGTLEDKSKSP